MIDKRKILKFDSSSYRYFLIGLLGGVFGNILASALWDLGAGKSISETQLFLFIGSVCVIGFLFALYLPKYSE